MAALGERALHPSELHLLLDGLGGSYPLPGEPSLAKGRQKELGSLLLSNLTRCIISVPMQPGGTGTSWDSGSPLHLEQT